MYSEAAGVAFVEQDRLGAKRAAAAVRGDGVEQRWRQAIVDHGARFLGDLAARRAQESIRELWAACQRRSSASAVGHRREAGSSWLARPAAVDTGCVPSRTGRAARSLAGDRRELLASPRSAVAATTSARTTTSPAASPASSSASAARRSSAPSSWARSDQLTQPRASIGQTVSTTPPARPPRTPT